MDRASERLNHVGQIRKLLQDIDRRGLWKPNSGSQDVATIENARDEILRELALIETELERAGLWDRSIDAEDGPETDASHAFTSLTLDQILQQAGVAVKILQNPRPA
jgi:hypothetical protein